MTELEHIELKNKRSRYCEVGATTKFLPVTNSRGARIRVTMAGRSKVVGYDYGAREPHVQAIEEAWEFFDFGILGTVSYVTESESRRGKVYLVTYEGKG